MMRLGDADSESWQLQVRTEKKTSVVTEACHLSMWKMQAKAGLVDYSLYHLTSQDNFQ